MWTSTTLLALSCAAAVLGLATSQISVTSGPTLDLFINNALIVTLAPAGTNISIRASDSITYLNNVVYTSNGYSIPGITQFYAYQSNGLNVLSSGGQLLGTAGKLYVQVPRAFFVVPSFNILFNNMQVSFISYLDGQVAIYKPSPPTMITNVQGTYITLQNVPTTSKVGPTTLQGAAYTFGPFNTWTTLQQEVNATNKATSATYTVNAISPNVFASVLPQATFYGPGLVLEDTQSTNTFFISDPNLIGQINDAFVQAIDNTFQIRYTGNGGTGSAYLTSGGVDLILLTGASFYSFVGLSSLTYQNNVVTFTGTGTPSFTFINYLSLYDGTGGLQVFRGGPGAIQRSFTTPAGTVILGGDNKLLYTTSQRLLEFISGNTNLNLVVSGTLVSVTRGNVDILQTTSASSYSVPSNVQVMYSGSNLQVGGTDPSAPSSLTSIKQLTTLVGGALTTYFLPTNIITLYGPGLLLYSRNGAFFTTDQTLQNQYSTSVTNILSETLGFQYSQSGTNLVSNGATLLPLSSGLTYSPVPLQATTAFLNANGVFFQAADSTPLLIVPASSFSYFDSFSITTAISGQPYSISGGGVVFYGGGSAFYSTSGQLVSFLSPPYTASQSLVGVSLTVQRGNTPIVVSSNTYSVPADSILTYSANTITVTNPTTGSVSFTVSPITSLTTGSSQQLVTSLSSFPSPINGPGFLVYNVSTGSAFYTTDPTQVANIQGYYSQTLANTFGLAYTTTPSGGTATVLTGGGNNLLQINGASSQPVPPGAVQAVYHGNTLDFQGSDGTVLSSLGGVNTFSYFSGTGLATLNVPGSGQVVPVQGGQLFTSQDRAFYTPSQQVVDYINSLSPVSYAVNGNQLVVTNGNTQVGTYSQYYPVPMGAQIGYSAGQPLTITAPMGMGTTTTTSLYNNYNMLTTFDGKTLSTVSSPATLQATGMGTAQLYYNQGTGQAHYLSSQPLISTIGSLYQGVYGSTFTFSYSSVRGTTQTTLRSVASGKGIVQLGVNPTITVPASATSVTFQNNTVTFAGTDPTASYPSVPASSLYVYSNTLTGPISQQGSPTPILGGGTLYTDGTSAFYTAHQQLNSFVTSGVTGAPPPKPTYFQLVTDPDTGAASLQADGLSVITITGSASQVVPYGYYVTYSGGTIVIYNSAGQPQLSIPNQSQVTVSDTNGAKTTVYQGSFPPNFPKLLVTAIKGGKGYSNGAQAFFTTDSAVISLVDQALLNPTTPSFQVVVKNGTATVKGGTSQSGTTTLVVGPNQKPLVPLAGAQTFTAPASTLVYYNNIVSILSNPTTLTGTPTYSASTSSITYGTPTTSSTTSPSTPTTSTISQVTSLLVYDGANLKNVTGSTSYPLYPGGTLYQSPTGDALYINPYPLVTYYPSNVLAALQQTSNTLYSQSNVSTLLAFDGKRLQTFTQSYPYILNGGGTYYINGGTAFFTSSPSLINTISTQSSALTNYNTTAINGYFYIIINGVPVYNFSASSTVVPLQSGDTIVYSAGVISNISSTIPGLPLPASSLIIDNGFTQTTYNWTYQFPQNGPGFLVVQPPTAGVPGSAFLSLSPSLTPRLIQAQTILMANYRPPVIAFPTKPIFASHYQVNVPPYPSPQFGQLIKVFQSADVAINCAVVDGYPQPTVTFYKQNGTVWEQLLSSLAAPPYILYLSDVTASDAGLYQCTAQNLAGSAFQRSQLVVSPAGAPSILTGFLVNKITPGQQVIQLSTSSPSPTPVNLNTVTNYVVNCKGQGKPRANISWQVNGVSLTQNTSSITIVSPKQGTSTLDVSVSAQNAPDCVSYTCIANNTVGVSSGSAIVCTQRYNCNSTGIFGACTATCGVGGYQVETLVCTFENGTSSIPVDYANIPNGYITNVPRVVGGCAKGDCPVITYQYEVSNFGSCSVTCGGGFQTRNASCVQVMSLGGSTNKTTVPDIQCLIAGKRLNTTLVGSCNTQACPTWSVGSFTACSTTCGAGVKTRTVQCIDATGVRNDSACFGQAMPPDTIPCNVAVCPFAWTYTNWGPCTPNCYVGIQTRSVSCVDVGNPTVPVNSSLCAGLPIPASTSRCGSGPCPGVGLWVTSAFSTVCTPCGNNGVQTRNVTCVDIVNRNVSSIYCNPDTQPVLTQPCFTACLGGCTTEPIYCPLVPKQFCTMFTAQCCKSCPIPTTTALPQATPTPVPGPG